MWTRTLLLWAAALSGAPAQTLITDQSGGSGAAGIMFDLENVSGGGLRVVGLDVPFLAAGTADVEVWTRAGPVTWVGSPSGPSGWQLVGGAQGVPHPGPGIPVPIPMAVGVAIPPGAVRGFYVTATAASGAAVSYALGTPLSLGTVADADGLLACRIGVGRTYPFGLSFGWPSVGRRFCGRVHYVVDARFQLDPPGFGLRLGGIAATPEHGARAFACPGDLVPADLLIGSPPAQVDVVVTSGPIVPLGLGGTATAGGQVLNLLLDATTIFVSTGSHVPAPFWLPGTFSVTLAAPATPGIVSMQALRADSTSPDGWLLSQACELVTSSPAGPGPIGPLQDNASVAIPLGCFGFLGASYSRVHVSDNGRVVFGGPDGNPVPTTAAALGGRPFAGAWFDFRADLGGSVVATMPLPQLLRIDWTQVPYAADPTVSASLRMELDLQSGDILLDGLAQLLPCTPQAGTTDWIWIGASPGWPLAVDPGPASFIPLATGASAPAQLLYTEGRIGQTAAGVQSIRLSPSGSGWNWSAF